MPGGKAGLMSPARPLLTADAMRAAEARWFAAGHDSFALMGVAAAAVAERAARLAPAGGSILVLAGPGNNGGDGHVAARLLAERSFQVQVAQLVPPGRLSGDAARAAAVWHGPGRPAAEADPAAHDLVIDALFGIGLSRPLEGEAQSLVERVNAAGRPVLAVDIASGLNADSGESPGVSIHAEETVSFHCAKPGHLLLPGRLQTGRLIVADIGLPPPEAPILWENGPGLWTIAVPGAGSHKYARGAALVWSGPALQTGASRLAAMGALRAGAGAVTLVGPRAALMVHAAHMTAVMLAEADAEGFARQIDNPRIRAACIGPGAGSPARQVAAAGLRAGRALVLDADALTAFAGQAGTLSGLVRARVRPVVLTPHEGEFTRLFPDCGGSRLERVRKAAAASGAVVVLKGADCVIAAPDGRAAINANAPAWLATAGSGDVLAGFITGFLAQGMEGFEAAAAGVFLHGAVAGQLGPGLIAEDLVGPVFREALARLLRAAGPDQPA